MTRRTSDSRAMRPSAAFAVWYLTTSVAPGACARTARSGAPAESASKQAAASGTASTPAPGSQVPGGCATPARERLGEIGCYLTATEPLREAPTHPIFWHLDAYPTRAAAEAARRERGTVVESLGRVWLFTIADAEWRPPSGERVARVGPLPVTPGRPYTARYMESVMPPGIPTLGHRHAGAEAWYMVAGAQCLETPDGAVVARAGETALVPGGPPMMLLGTGSEVRRTIVLVVHDSAQPWMTPAADWTPTGTCQR